MKTVRKEIEEIFRTNQLGCNGHVMPTIEEWNKIGLHINELTAQVEELKGIIDAFERATDLWLPSTVEDEHYDELVALHRLRNKYLKLLTRIGEDNE